MRNVKISLFIQCIVDALYPQVADALVKIFRSMNMDMDCPADQTCCGQPAFNAGYRNQAKIAARHFINVFEPSEVIVCPSGSCVNMVRNHYAELFHDEPYWRERARMVGAKTYEFTEFLVDFLKIEDLGARRPGKITYHDSCHLLRYLGIQSQPRRLLNNVAQAEFIEMPDSDRCCGFGGSFAIHYHEISAALAKDKVRDIIASGADVVVGCDMGCLMNIQGIISRQGLPVQTMHIAQLLADGLP